MNVVSYDFHTIFFMQLHVDHLLSTTQGAPKPPHVGERCDPWARNGPQRIHVPFYNGDDGREEDDCNAKPYEAGLKSRRIHVGETW